MEVVTVEKKYAVSWTAPDGKVEVFAGNGDLSVAECWAERNLPTGTHYTMSVIVYGMAAGEPIASK